MKKIIFLIFIFTIHLQLRGQYSEILNSNRPGNSISAYNVGMSIYQIESGFSASSNKFSDEITEASLAWKTAIRYASDEFLEYYLEISPNALWIDDNGTVDAMYQFSPISVGATYRFNEASGWKPATALRGGLMYYQNTDKQSYGDIEAVFVTQNQIANSWVFITNWRLKKIIFNTNASYILSVTNTLSEKWSWFIENMGEYDLKSEREDKFQNYFNAGIAYLVNNNFQADIFAGMDTGLNTYFLSIGISWRPGGVKSKYNAPTGAEMVMPPPK